MFDIGFFELLLIIFVILIVLGPEKLPDAVKSSSKALLWLKKQSSKTKQEFTRIFGLNEIYQDSRNEEILEGLKESKK
ncbi:MAG TPA: Sec-independent protein translocase protein TatB [SAR86 cluster bacterium]|jgi:sec-independent protein translocase protein TatB|nr:Sec-independent protein translocase protein TatB [SAR86 cluster bacterium]